MGLSTARVQLSTKMVASMRTEPLVQEPKDRDLNLHPESVATLHWHSTITILRTRVRIKVKLRLSSLNLQLVKVKDNSDPVPTALHRHRQTRPAASASLSRQPNSQAGPQLHLQVNPLLVKEKAQPALESHPSELVPVAKHPTQP